MTEKEFNQQQKIIRTIKKRFADENIELFPWDNEEVLCSTLNIISDELRLPLRFEIVWTDNECWIFTYVWWIWDIYLWKFSCLSAEWVAKTIITSMNEHERLKGLIPRENRI